MRRPIIAATVTAILLLAIATPVLRLHMGQADFTAFPDTLDGVQAVNLLNEKWPSGSTLEESSWVPSRAARSMTAGSTRRKRSR